MIVHTCKKHGELTEEQTYIERVHGYENKTRYKCNQCNREKSKRNATLRRQKLKSYCQFGAVLNSYKAIKSATLYQYRLKAESNLVDWLHRENHRLHLEVMALKKQNEKEMLANERLLNRLLFVESTGRVDAPRVLRLKEVMARTGVARSSLYNMMTQGRFPQSLQVSKRAVGWREKDIDEWVQQLSSLR